MGDYVGNRKFILGKVKNKSQKTEGSKLKTQLKAESELYPRTTWLFYSKNVNKSIKICYK